MTRKGGFTITVALFTIVGSLFSAAPAHAVFGFGDTVFDASAYTQQLLNYATQLQQYYTQMQQYQTQVRQLQNEVSNMRNLNYKGDLSDLDEVHHIMNSSLGISNDYTKMQGQFEQLYPDFASYQGQKSSDYAKQSAEWSKNNQQNARDMLAVTTKLKESIARDQNSLRYLNNRSDSASGTKDLLQTMNQLLIMQTKQLMQLQQLIATSIKADAAYLAEKASNNEASRAAGQDMFRDWTKRGNRRPAPNPSDVLR